jgi:hypothetical protein
VFAVAQCGIDAVGCKAFQFCDFVDVQDHGFAAAEEIYGIQELLHLTQGKEDLENIVWGINEVSAVYGFNVQDLSRINDDLDISLCSGQLLPGAVHKAKDLFHLLGKALIPEDQFVFALVDLFYRVFHCVIPFCFGLVVILSAS